MWTGVEVIGYAASTPSPRPFNRYHAGWEPRDRHEILEALANANDDAHVYVHGFNNSLQFACRTAALLARDRVAICVAWPSNPPLPRSWAIAAVLSVAERNYTAAEQQMQRSVRSVANAALQLREACKRRLDWTPTMHYLF